MKVNKNSGTTAEILRIISLAINEIEEDGEMDAVSLLGDQLRIIRRDEKGTDNSFVANDLLKAMSGFKSKFRKDKKYEFL